MCTKMVILDMGYCYLERIKANPEKVIDQELLPADDYEDIAPFHVYIYIYIGNIN